MKGLLNLFSLAIIAVLIGSALVNYKAVKVIADATTNFLATTYAAELGVIGGKQVNR